MPPHVLDQASQCGPGRDLEHTLVVEVAGQGDEHGAGVVGVAHRLEPLGTEPGYQGDVGQRLDVVHQGRPAPGRPEIAVGTVRSRGSAGPPSMCRIAQQ